MERNDVVRVRHNFHASQEMLWRDQYIIQVLKYDRSEHNTELVLWLFHM